MDPDVRRAIRRFGVDDMVSTLGGIDKLSALIIMKLRDAALLELPNEEPRCGFHNLRVPRLPESRGFMTGVSTIRTDALQFCSNAGAAAVNTRCLHFAD